MNWHHKQAPNYLSLIINYIYINSRQKEKTRKMLATLDTLLIECADCKQAIHAEEDESLLTHFGEDFGDSGIKRGASSQASSANTPVQSLDGTH